jgi:hypothetical protein
MSGEGESVTSQAVASSVIWALYGIMLYSALVAQVAVCEEWSFDNPVLIPTVSPHFDPGYIP